MIALKHREDKDNLLKSIKTIPMKEFEKEELYQEKVEVKPLKPTDPTGAILKCHGHFIIHLTYLIVCLTYIDPDSGKYVCFKKETDGSWKFINEGNEDKNAINDAFWQLTAIHMVCFILEFISFVWTNHDMQIVEEVFKMLLQFVCIPIYLNGII